MGVLRLNPNSCFLFCQGVDKRFTFLPGQANATPTVTPSVSARWRPQGRNLNKGFASWHCLLVKLLSKVTGNVMDMGSNS